MSERERERREFERPEKVGKEWEEKGLLKRGEERERRKKEGKGAEGSWKAGVD